MSQLLFETPWWLPVGILIAGVAVWVAGNNRTNTRLKLAGIGLALLGGLLALVSYLVDTDRERVLKRTGQLVRAIEARDWEKAKPLLHPKVHLLLWQDRDTILRGAQVYIDRHGLKKARLSALDARPDDQSVPPTITASFTVASDHNEVQNYISSWRLTWVRTPEGWAVRDIEPQSSPLFGDITRLFTTSPP